MNPSVQEETQEQVFPDYFNEAANSYDAIPDYFNEAAKEFNQNEYSWTKKIGDAVNSALPSSRNVMQAAIGTGQGLVYRNPVTAGVAAAADFLFPAQVEEEIRNALELDREYQEIYKNAPDKLPPLDEQKLREGAAATQKKLLGNESLVTGILSAPFRAIGIDTTPENISENLNRNAFSLITGLSSGKFNSVLPPSSANYYATNLSKTVPLAYTAAGMGEIGKELYGLPGEVIASMLFGGGYAAYQKGKDWVKNFKQNVPLTPDKFPLARISPERAQEVSPFLRIAEEKGIPLTPGMISDSAFTKGVEKFIFENNLTRNEAQEFRELAAREFAAQYDRYLQRTQGAYSFSEPGAIAQELRNTVINPKERMLREQAVTNYTNSAKGFRGADPIPQKEAQRLALLLNEIVGQVSKSLIPTSAESGTAELARTAAKNISQSPTQVGKPELESVRFPIGEEEKQNLKAASKLIESAANLKDRAEAQRRYDRAQEILSKGKELTAAERAKAQESLANLKEIMGDAGDYLDIDERGNVVFTREIYPENLVATARSLSEIVEWDQRGVVNFFKPFRREVQDILERNYEFSHPVALQQYKQANKDYGEAAQMFWAKDAPFKKWNINSSTTPERLANSLNSVRSFQELENTFGKTKEGQQLIDYMKRLKLDKILKPTFDQMRQDYVPGKFAAKFESLETNNFVKYLMGPKAYRQFKELADLDKFIKKNAAKDIYNSSIPAETSNPFYSILKAAAFVWNYPSAVPAVAGTLAAQNAAKKYVKEVAALYKNPDLAKQFVTIAQKSIKKNADPKLIAAEMDLVMHNLRLQAAQDEAISVLTPNS